ncbi:hypothetical protein AMAG_06371 [Allomyces macrogynus ATCC 38327]|uniref:C2 domain-containing protein n=1 Tax=Allomyces macrogynus (strain ATCC 38327) TaxID=578462 RepID=A0A0L0SGS0_ALLM3|nr:hypothetical protein AMAG_06371 [Allomyces macrogynus ATCC 38327]|eukprot:KNE61555.1 hypothetical protein AMAG_06371 [Allomyces macrogynus ATCC 38327]
MSYEEDSYEAGMRRHNEELQQVMQAEQDLIRIQQQQAAMNAGYLPPQQPSGYDAGYGPMAPQQQYYAPPPQDDSYYAPAAEPQIGPLQGVFIEILEGRNLKDVEVLGDMDPYARVVIGDQDVRTRAHKDEGCNLFFNDTLEVAVTDGVEEIIIEIWDSNKYNITGDTIVGTTRVPLSDLRNGQFQDRWLELRDEDGESAGELHVKFTPRTVSF